MLPLAAKLKKLTYNNENSVFSTTSLNLLGYEVSHQQIKPDTERLRLLQEPPAPIDAKSLKPTLGLFSYYSRWIPHFSKKFAPLVKIKTFPLDSSCIEAFITLRKGVESLVVCSISENEPFELETDASDIAIAGLPNQNDRTFAFFSRSLHRSELEHPPVEKEARAIIESV